ncbi:MAG: SBBP repeat-containing protein [Thermoleophilia bacterium]
MRRAAIATAALCAAGLVAGGALLATGASRERVTGHVSPVLAQPAAAAPAAATPPPAGGSIVPLHFEQNVGQAPADVRFLARGAGSADALLGADGVTVGDLRLALDRAVRAATVEGVDPLAARIDYFVGPRSHWHTDVPAFGEVLYRGVYPGIDLRYHGTLGALEHDFVVAPGADASVIGLLLEGSRAAQLDGGDLVVSTAGGEARLKAPFAYQDVDGERVAVPARFVLDGDRVAFELGAYDASRELVIDPILQYATYAGGGADADNLFGSAVGPDGTVVAVGRTNSTNFTNLATFPTGGFQTACNLDGASCSNDVYIVKVDPTKTGAASLVYASYYGGTKAEGGADSPWVAVDASGRIYVVGSTVSPDLPIVNGFDTQCDAGPNCNGGLQDGFLAVLDPTIAGAGALVYSTFIGGAGSDIALAVAADAAGNAYVTGETNATDFPVSPGALQATSGGGADSFLVKVNTAATGAASKAYASYYGGTQADTGKGVTVDATGKATIAGETTSPNLTTSASAFDATCGVAANCDAGKKDAFVARFDPAASGAASLLYATYLGGAAEDGANGVAADPRGRLWVAGDTQSPETSFPVTTGAFDATCGTAANCNTAKSDAFLARIDPTATGAASLSYSTYLGGADTDVAFGVAVDSTGNAFAVGTTNSTDFPITPDRLQADGPASDAFLVKVSGAAAPTLLYGSYIAGGSATDKALSVGVGRGLVAVAGETFSGSADGTQNIPGTEKGFDTSCGTTADPTCGAGATADGFIHVTAFRTDLSVTATLPATGKPGTAIALGLTVANAGPDVATGVAVASTIPAGVTIGSPTASQGSCSTAGQVVTCALGQLASGGSATVSISLTPTQVGALPTTSTVTGGEGDPNGGNDTAAAQATISTNGTVGDPPGGSDTTGPKVAIGKAGILRLDARGRVTVTLTCPAAEQSGPCSGTVGLRSKGKLDPARILSAKRFVALGSAKFTLAAGKKRGVKVRLNATGRALVRELRSLRAVVTVKAKDAKGNRRTVTKTVTLKPRLAKRPR